MVRNVIWDNPPLRKIFVTKSPAGGEIAFVPSPLTGARGEGRKIHKYVSVSYITMLRGL